MLADAGEFGPDTVTLDDYYNIGASQNPYPQTTSAPPVQYVQTAAAQTAPPTNWGSILTPIANAVGTVYTQYQTTQRQQAALNAGVVPAGSGLISTNAAGQSTIFGVPSIFVIGGIAAFMLMK